MTICFSMTHLVGLFLTCKVLQTLKHNDQVYLQDICCYHLIHNFIKNISTLLEATAILLYFSLLRGCFYLCNGQMIADTARNHEMYALFHLEILKQVFASSVGYIFERRRELGKII